MDRDTLLEIRDLIDGYVDIRDGSDGRPLPNDAMRAQMMIDELIATLHAPPTNTAAGSGHGWITGTADVDAMNAAAERCQSAVPQDAAPVAAPLTLPEEPRWIVEARNEIGPWTEALPYINALRAFAEQLLVMVSNQREQITGRHKYVGQDYQWRIKRLTERAEALVAALKEDAERYRQGKHMGVISAAQERLIDAARSVEVKP